MKAMPFAGVLAVGQAAALVAFLPFLVNSLEFGIFVCGSSLLKEEERLIEDWPVLHIIGNERADSNQRLIAQFGGTVHESKAPLDTGDLNVIGKV